MDKVFKLWINIIIKHCFKMEIYLDFLRLIVLNGFKVVCFVLVLTILLVFFGFFMGQNWREEWSKITSFECGFDPLRRSRCTFSLRFFLLALLFLVFDVELVLVFPFIYRIRNVYVRIRFLRKMLVLIFMAVLLLGLIHEYNEGTLDWVEDK